MKKTLVVISLLLAIVLIFLCLQFVRNSVNKTTPASTETPITSTTPAQTPEPTVSATTEPVQTPDPRNEERVVRAEIANLIRDAKELLAEGLNDDASMILRDLRTRDLTSAEKEQVDALQASMVTISD